MTEGIHHVALTVSDLDLSQAWYQEVFGLEVQFEERGEDRNAVVLRTGTTVIGLVEHAASHSSSPFDPATIGLDHVAFNAVSRPQLETLAQHLADLGIDTSGVIDIPVGAILNFKDPDGIALSWFWDRPEP